MSAAVLPSFVYPVVDSAHWVERLVGAGARLVQLRIKQAEATKLRREIELSRRACAAAGAQLVVNDHWRLAIDLGADFIHLGQEDLERADRAAISASGARLGVSTHSLAELERALAVAPDYVALGPIYPTTLKQMPFAPHGLAPIGDWKRRVGKMPLVAIGGITLERSRGCFEAGADCVAMVSDILSHEAPESRLQAWLELKGPGPPGPGGSRAEPSPCLLAIKPPR